MKADLYRPISFQRCPVMPPDGDANLDVVVRDGKLKGEMKRSADRSVATALGGRQNIELSFFEDDGTTCSTSQCSTTFPLSSNRKISIPA